jgi:hypothetical protein
MKKEGIGKVERGPKSICTLLNCSFKKRVKKKWKEVQSLPILYLIGLSRRR